MYTAEGACPHYIYKSCKPTWKRYRDQKNYSNARKNYRRLRALDIYRSLSLVLLSPARLNANTHAYAYCVPCATHNTSPGDENPYDNNNDNNNNIVVTGTRVTQHNNHNADVT